MHATAVAILTAVVQWRIRDFENVGLIGEVSGRGKKPRTTVSESWILFVGKQARFISNSFRPISLSWRAGWLPVAIGADLFFLSSYGN